MCHVFQNLDGKLEKTCLVLLKENHHEIINEGRVRLVLGPLYLSMSARINQVFDQSKYLIF